MSHVIIGNIACKHDSFGLGIILQLLDDVRKSRQGVLAPDIDLRVRIVECDLSKNRLGLIDLLEDGSFNQAIQGCEVVYYVASPFLVPSQIKDGMNDCIEPALKGTGTALESAIRTLGVKHIVLTSSSKCTSTHSGNGL